MTIGLPTLELPDRQISAIGLGTARLGAFWQGRSIGDGRRTIETARQLGLDMFDTADVYARGIAERIIGSVGLPTGSALIITKAGLIKTPAAMAKAYRLGAHGAQRLSGLRPTGVAGKCFQPEYLKWAIDGSRKRLKLDVLDVFLLHEPDEGVLRDRAAAQVLAELRSQGKIRRWGVSVRTAGQAVAAMELEQMSWLQVPAAILDSPDFGPVAEHARRSEVVVQAMAVTGVGHSMLGGAEPPQEKIARGVKTILDRGRADSVLVGMSSGRRVYQNVAAMQRSYRGSRPAAESENGDQR
ncbi:aldo/keto reductase [Arthrobacter russicus]|uniref:Aryl-alcohol dehydrogenase-like predicted oxidoreductase n=1 Tax=Arthrobacter russicus TaxID=172040 RepID=A0ABU1JDE1_9MICC|nr:aldo/keto reductase [Arthrobacter russicus]MDN5668016.1 aldo/keto reductase [Renibacterium salmoninarum]MDR6270446.1 aryl-alcohol dehydrogenase-like predicted oxidoreductase [Arthrobacter russicus]